MEVAVAFQKVLSQNFPGKTEDKHRGLSHTNWSVGRK